MQEEKQPMTLYGYQKLQDELNHLKLVERPQNTKAIEEALEHGDLKENAEYHAAKERQVNIDERLNELTSIIGSATLVDPSSLAHAKVSFGSTILLCDLESDEEISYTIVGACESNPAIGLISFHSPLAKQLLGKEEGDEFKAKLPMGVKEFEVLEVSYKEIIFESH
ncbi:MAG: transcription elongation factor GreA [Campylobacterota bacterium]|nr:transcription elongation factor GreA [Campylobacterota bacterium]